MAAEPLDPGSPSKPHDPDNGPHIDAQQRPARRQSGDEHISRPDHSTRKSASGSNNTRSLHNEPARRVPQGPQRPQFSLAGTQAPVPIQQPYVDEEYYRLNPNYSQVSNVPIWGLARTLPHTVRPAMRRPSHPKPLEQTRRAALGQKDDAPESAPAESNPPSSPQRRQQEHGPGTQPAPQIDLTPAQQKDKENRSLRTDSFGQSDRPQAG